MFELKKMSREGIRRALGKVERYRLLNEPWEAESICQDVLQAEPDNQEALISLLLAMTDQFGHEGGGRRCRVRALFILLPRDRDYPSNSRARAHTSSNIASVSLPVKVFCWLG